METKTLTEGSVVKLFFKYLIPAICGTMVTSIYVLADTIIIGKGLGMAAMAALNIVLPLFNIFYGIGLLFGVGGSVLMSFARGRGDYRAGQMYYSLALVLNVTFCVVITAVLLMLLRPVVTLLGATDVTMPYIMGYAPYVIGGASFFALSSFFQTFVRNDGAPKHAMAAVISGGVLNIILDIVFVFPLRMGMTGAALATVIGSVTTFVILLFHLRAKHNGLKFNLAGIGAKHIMEVFKTGFTSFLLEITSGIVMFIFNIQILKYIGDVGVSVYGIMTNTNIVIYCLCNGINQAAQPLVSVNFGAGLYSRVKQVKNVGIKVAIGICSLFTIIGLVAPNVFTYMFLNPNQEVLQISGTAIRIYFAGFFLMGVNMFMTGFFQSTLRPALSMILCLSRGVVFSILFVFLLPPLLGTAGIWAAMPLAEVVTCIMAALMIIRVERGRGM